MTRWKPLWVWILCWWTVLQAPVASGSLDRSWCYTKDELPHTISCSRGNVVYVVRAVPSVHTASNHHFCQDPTPGSNDCQLAEHEQTDHFRRMCNMQRTCVFLLVHRPLNTCVGASGGAMYLHMEYKCSPDTSQGKKIPVVLPSLSRQSEGEGPVVWIQSSSYPSLWDDLVHMPCTIIADTYVGVKVTVQDLTLNQSPTDRISCRYNVYVHNTTKICARQGMVAHTVDVAMGSTRVQDLDTYVNVAVDIQLDFTAANHRSTSVPGRYWVEIAGFLEDGATPASVKVTCTNQQLPAEVTYTNEESKTIIWLPILMTLLIIIVAVIIGIVIWYLRRRTKKANISKTESTEDDDRQNCRSRICPPFTFPSMCPCPCKRKTAVDSQTNPETGTNTDSKKGYGNCLRCPCLRKKAASESNPKEDNEKDDESDLSQFVENSLHESDAKQETLLSRLRNHLSRKKLPPSVDKREGSAVNDRTHDDNSEQGDDSEKNENSDLCQPIENLVCENDAKRETLFTRLQDRLSRKKPLSLNNKKGSVIDGMAIDDSSEQDKLAHSDRSDKWGCESDTPEKERLYNKDTTLDKSETAV